MRHFTTFDGIRFYESHPQGCQVIDEVKVELGGIFSQAQLKTLDDVKHQLAKLAKSKGGNAIVDFKYGQASVGFWRSLLQLDDVNWYGHGSVAIVR